MNANKLQLWIGGEDWEGVEVCREALDSLAYSSSLLWSLESQVKIARGITVTLALTEDPQQLQHPPSDNVSLPFVIA